MRVVLSTIAPNITLPIWARLFRRSILPVVDRCEFIVGSPHEELRSLAHDTLDFADLAIRPEFQSHGHALTELVKRHQQHPDTSILLLEDDCYVTCPPAYIDGIFTKLPDVGGAMGSRMALSLEDLRGPGGQMQGPDSFGSGLYPNMAFYQMSTLLAHTNLDFTSYNFGDVGHHIGRMLHEKGVHLSPESHLPQCRLSMYAGTVMVDPEKWEGPWLHVGEMSGVSEWKPETRGGHYEALAAYAAAIDTGECRPGAALERMAANVAWAENRELYRGGRYPVCKKLMARVYQ